MFLGFSKVDSQASVYLRSWPENLHNSTVSVQDSIPLPEIVPGNEWNYNGLYVGSSFFDCVGRISAVRVFLGDHMRGCSMLHWHGFCMPHWVFFY